MVLDVIGIGSACIDTIVTTKATRRRIGGSVLNTLLALQAIGSKTGTIGRVGNDASGRRIIKMLKKKGIDISMLRRDNRPTNQYRLLMTSKNREIVSVFSKDIDKFSSGDKSYIKNAKSAFLRIENPMFREYSAFAEKYGIKLYLSAHDFHADNLRLFDGIKATALFASESEIDKKSAITLSKKMVVLRTLGEKGCEAYVGGKVRRYTALRVRPLDPTGAGDAFAAGYIFGDLNGWTLECKCNFANSMGALATKVWGARTE